MTRLIAICMTLASPLIWAGQPALADVPSASLQAEAESALVSGDTQRAIRLARDDKRQRPTAFPPVFILALGLFEAGHYRDAAEAAVAAFGRAVSPSDKRQSAQLAGNAWFAAGNYTRAAFWLRRAADYAETYEESVAIAHAYLHTREANPLALQATAWIAPTDNINNGAEEATFQLEGLPFDFVLPPDRQALSGMEYALELQGRYRLFATAQQRTTAGFYIFGQTYALSPESRELLPDADGHDFSYVVADVSLSHERQFLEGWGPTLLGINTGRVWSGRDPTWSYLTVAAQQNMTLGKGEVVSLRLARTRQSPLTDANVETDITDLSASYRVPLSNGDSLLGKLTGVHSDGGFENIYTELRGEIDFGRVRPIGPLHLSGRVALGYRSYDTFPTTLDGRRDRFASVGIDAHLKGWSFWGFSPLLSLRTSRTVSSAEEFTSQSLQVQLGVKSNF